MVSPPVVERRPGSIEKMPRPVLPPGVTERDLEMFKKAQEKASQVSAHVYLERKYSDLNVIFIH